MWRSTLSASPTIWRRVSRILYSVSRDEMLPAWGLLSRVHPGYCTPFNATVFVGGRLFGSKTRSKQRRVIEGGSSEPPGPGKNAAGLALFRYRTRCGTVWGHTANTAGYTQFAAASPDGRRSVTVSVNARLTPTVGRPAVFRALRRAEGLAVCAALAGR